MNLVITGASGFIGRCLVQDFLARGTNLLLIGRNPEHLRRLFPSVECCSYDDLPVRGRGHEGILHLAVLNNNTSAALEEYMRANVDLTSQVLEAAKRAGIRRFVNVSTIQALDTRNKSNYAVSKRIAAGNLDTVTGIDVRTLYLAAVTGDRLAGRLAILNRCPRSVRRHLVSLLSAISATVSMQIVIEDCWGALTETDGPQRKIVTNDQTKNLAFSLLKRLVDLTGALAILIPFSWLLAVIWVAVRVQSAGPSILAQQRVGRNGKVFTCYKFRTMSADAPNVGTHEAPAELVTPLGRFLRRTKLDELPQAVNILFNEMTLVGPRPSLPNQASVIEEREARGVLAIKPGITGLAQIHQIDMSQPKLLAEWDERYLKTRSLRLDLNILVATALGRGRGDAMDAPSRAKS